MAPGRAAEAGAALDSTAEGSGGSSAVETAPAGRGGGAGRAGRGGAILAVAGFLLVGTSQGFTVPYTGLGLSPAQLTLLALGALWVITRVLGQRAPLGLGVLSGLVVVRLCFDLISYGLASGHTLTSDQRTAADRTLLIEAVSVLLVVLAPTLLRSRRDVERVMGGLVAGGALSGTFALLQYATGIDLGGKVHLPGLRETVDPFAYVLVRGGVVRGSGAAAQPLELAAVTTTLIPLAMALWFTARSRGERSWPWALAGAIMAGGAVVSLSRSVFVALAVAGLVMALRWPVRRSGALAAGVLAVGLAAVVSGSRVVSAVTMLLTQGSDDFSLGSRQVGRAYVASHATDHFWWGQGPGTYDLTSQPVLDNQYLSQLMETGALGLLASVLLLVCALAYALAASARSVTPDLRELAIGVAGSMVVLMVVQTTLDTAGFVQISLLGWLVIGLAATVWRLGVGPGRDEVLTPAADEAR